MLRRRFAWFVAFACAMSIAAAVTGSTGMGAGAATPVASAGLSAWKSCGKHLQCSILDVPVDYTQPNGPRTEVAVARIPATGPQHRLGSLVFNFGGPGDAGTATLPDFARDVPSSVRARYDLVSFDPRGTGSSHPVECVDDATADRLTAVDPTPSSDAELQSFYDGTHEPVDLVARCVARNAAWLAQIGSRNVARDMDRLRAALGDEHLDYLGFSYGTVIGAVYAEMFPDRVGRMVLDSPVDLSQSAAEELRGNADGFERALDDFLSDCASRKSCAFHNDGDPTGALTRLKSRFENGVTLPTVDLATGKRTSRKAGVGAFYTALISALYDKEFGWPTLAQALRQAQKGDGSLLEALADSYNGRRDNGHYDNINEVIGIILCDDREDAVPSFDDYVAQYHHDLAAYPFLGGYVGSTVLGCDSRLPRPPASEQVGDVRVTGVPPIVVVGTTQDPATPFTGAEDLAGRLHGARLLTFESTEHTAYTKSPCIDNAVDGYLLRGTLPDPGTTCRS